MVAGPSEILVLADKKSASSNEIVVTSLIGQAEHGCKFTMYFNFKRCQINKKNIKKIKSEKKIYLEKILLTKSKKTRIIIPCQN